MMKIKLTAWVLISLILTGAPRTGYTQSTYSPSQKQKSEIISLDNALKKLSDVFNTQFVYEKSLLDGKNTLYKEETIKGKTVEEVLKNILYPNNLVFLYVKKNYYSIAAKDQFNDGERAHSDVSYTALTESNGAMRDQIIEGKVTDRTGKAMTGVTVNLKGTTLGTSTNGEGQYTIHVASSNGILVFSYIGFATQEIPVNGQSIINVQMLTKESELQTVVVSALGIAKNVKSITYATQGISGEEVNKVKDPNFMNTLAGKAAGVVITKGGGGPGSSSRIILRGNKSILGSNSPLYVIDGVPMNNATGSQTGSLYGAFDGGDAISNINAEDIQGVQILQGASAAALYGSQAANGVILITTKKGRKGVAKVDYSSTAIFESPIGLPQLQTKYGQSDPNLNDSWGPKITNGSDRHLKEFFQTGSNYINAVSVSNGNDLGQFYLSYANTQVKGIVPENDLNKHNITLRGTTQLLNNRLSLDASVNYINQKVYNRPQAGFNFNPIFPLYSFPTGDDWSKYSGNNYEIWSPVRQMYVQNWPYIRNETLNSQNPYWIQKRDQNDLFRDRTISSIMAKYKIFDWLNIQARTTYDRVEDSYEQRVSASTDAIEAGINGGYTTNRSNNNQLYSDLLLMGNKNITKDISFSGTLGLSNTQNNYSGISLSSTNATSLSYPNYFSVYALNGQFNKSESKTKILNQAAFGNLTFGYKEKLFLDVTGRNEWSSTVAQPFFYPSVGLSYVLLNNRGNTGALSFAKLRGSYAQVGNSLPFGVASFAPPYSLDNGGNINGRNALPFFNGTDTLKLKPERTKSYEIGADLRFFHDKLSLNLTYYNATTYDQVFQIQAPAGAGAANFWINGGTILNKGIEAILSYNTALGKVKWTTTVTFARNKNQIRELSNLLKADRFVLTDYNDTRLVALFLTRPVNGKYGSYGDMFGKVYQKEQNGKFLTDSTGLPLLSATADHYIGNANPNFLAGLNNTFTFKNVSLSFLIDGRFGGGVASATERWLDYKGLSKRTGIARDNGGVMVNGKLIDTKDYYYNQTGAGSQGAVSEYFFDATNIRLRELSLGYTLPKFSHVVKELTFSLVGRNLFFFYKKAPFDPEVSINASNSLQGIEAYNLPSTSSYGISLRATL
ncbi:SusC/RagA family TonB-linked outer membrane protein [Ferruginibacter paludis]|uniref:SusC/RagA family TonB-linked outer membrane protein n=1 Tax=Ferruginibacter paludis TaxID=1310417 RepID=UPI0025B57F54|nr:SusC/RagA family TonB-linked outer membrane protein [Ferruginibacter paludis]MDN3654016.1 SusC/RagA family TonB-linked outer membrane protein [Ferruginibacter paludis]